VLVLNHATPDMPGNGNVYRVIIGGSYTLDGNLRGPVGPKGDQGDVGLADLIPIVQRIDLLEARVARLESFHLVTITDDVQLDDDEDILVGYPVPLPAGSDYQGSAHLTFELSPAILTSLPRLVVAWIEASGAVVITGPASAQFTLHSALPYGSLDIGPIRAVATGAASIVLNVRTTVIGGSAPGPGYVVLKARTSALNATTPKLQATGLIAR
jgi:hypothetical protein